MSIRWLPQKFVFLSSLFYRFSNEVVGQQILQYHTH